LFTCRTIICVIRARTSRQLKVRNEVVREKWERNNFGKSGKQHVGIIRTRGAL